MNKVGHLQHSYCMRMLCPSSPRTCRNRRECKVRSWEPKDQCKAVGDRNRKHKNKARV